MREGDDEMTYFLLFRHAHLFLSNLSTHPQYKKNDPTIKALEKDVSQNLKALDLLRPQIRRKHEEYTSSLQARQRRRVEEAAKRKVVQGQVYLEEQEPQSRRARLSGQENADLAARLAGLEFSKRGSSRRANPTASSMQTDRDDLAARMQAVRNRIDHPERSPVDELERQSDAYLANNTGYSYPTVPSQRPDKQQSEPPESYVSRAPLTYRPAQPPSPPPKPQPARDTRAATLPPRPEKTTASLAPAKAEAEPSYVFAPGAHLENGTPLRTIFLPPTIRTTFLRLAHKNTIQNLETCGFLAGTLRANALFVSTLIVPKQTSTSDTCEMTDESELFDYVDTHNLMVLGWIHTHPTQTCFMSSRDLHTHSGYQMMLAESIAIVCAPSKGDTSHGGDWGVYRLTDPPGKMAILQCERPGIFHPHDVDNIYTDAMRPGHVIEISKMDFEIVDLRQSSH